MEGLQAAPGQVALTGETLVSVETPPPSGLRVFLVYYN